MFYTLSKCGIISTVRKMKVIFEKTLAGSNNKRNEDAYFIGDDYALVLDGATSLEGEDVPKYIAALLQAIVRHYAKNMPLREVVRMAIKDMKRLYSMESPSAAIAMARIGDEKIELLTLGDCVVIYITQYGSVKEFRNNSRLFELNANVYKKMEEISKERNISPLVARNTKEIKKMLIDNRHKKNKKDGYYILDNEENALDYASYVSLDKEKIEYIILASDGLSSYYREMQIGSINDFANNIIGDGEQVFATLREKENADKDLEHIRFKISDDATGIVIKVKD